MSTEPRALSAALSSPAFVTRGGGAAIHAANRHVERWAPEAEASRIRPLRNLGFVDRLVSPWIESAQRSASMRLFSQYISTGASERPAPTSASWVFPRPWYQDELDWMAAARQVGTQTADAQAAAPNLLTTRGTYVAPAEARESQIALSTTLHEYIAPSLSVARPDVAGETYSPLVPFAATQAAYVMARAVAPLAAQAQMSPGLRAVLTSMLARATHSRGDVTPTRASMSAPELVTPPAPRRGAELAPEPALQLAEQYAEQHAHIAELQRMARAAAEREHARREAALSTSTTSSATAEAQLAEIRAAQARVVDQRSRDDAARQQEALRLHEQSREAAARDARIAPVAPSAEPRAPQVAPESRVALELAAAVAALPPELASLVSAGISQRPERAAQSIAELGEALRSVELIARTSAAGGSFAPTRGPRVVMPAGLGGLVSTVEHTMASDRAPSLPAFAPIAAAAARTPALAFLGARRARTSALGAATSAMPAALTHVAWSDRWLARFAGASPSSLDVLAAAASPETRMQMLASAAPHAVFVAPVADDEAGSSAFSGTRTQDVLPTLRGGPAPAQPVLRFDDDAETPDDMFAAIAMSASRARAGVVAAPPPPPTTAEPERQQPRDTLADLVAHAAPGAPGAGLSAQLASSPFAPALRHVLPLGIAPAFDVRALFGAGLSATYLAGLVSASTNELAIASWGESPAVDFATRSALDFEPTYVMPELAALTTLRSALLAWDAESVGATTQSGALARTMVDSLARPMLGDSAVAYDGFGDETRATTYAAPGMVADRAHAWSVAQERSSADLAFDFVSPELVLAARVYGLGPAEAAQAARLAVAGPGQLTAMAGAVDRTFVQAMAIELDRRGERTRAVSAYPIAVEAGAGSARDAQPYAADSSQRERAGFATSSSTFGVERRAPRGAFLWPAGTTAALELSAPRPDSEHSTSVAALELLAARAVAELGTFTALSDIERVEGAGTTSRGVIAEPHDEDVLAAAGTLVPAARRDKFEALYVALGQSPVGRTSSPAARAARAVALAGRGGETISARERATIAWDVLPVVHGFTDGADDDSSSLSTGDSAARAIRRREQLRSLDPTFVDARPGLGALSARAGEALGSYVTPTAATTSSGSASTSTREVGAVLRAPTAAPELVQTGRPAGRHGGGEVEIPAWFEAAARKMFEQKASVSDGISLAELTLVTAAPAPQIAASSRTASAPASVAPASAAAEGAQKQQQVDIEKLANDVYREVLVLMDIARARNGEPYL